jgi:hypothetical protein
MSEAVEGELIAAAAGRPMTDEEVREALGGEPGPDDLTPTFAEPGCVHPPSARRLIDGEQVCTACGEAVAPYRSEGRSAEQRNDDALLQCLDLYEEWQQLELVCRTAREGMHNLRSMLVGLMAVAKSIGAALGGYR